MKIPPSSPYAAFNPKEWNSNSKMDKKFSNAPIKVKKKYFGTFIQIKTSKIVRSNNGTDKLVQLAFA